MEYTVIEIISHQSKVSVSNITMTTNLAVDLKLDSFDLVELTMLLEEKFNVIFTSPESQAIKTVGDAIDLIRKKTN